MEMSAKSKLVMGVTTYNRLEYLKVFISTWEQTRDQGFDWTLIITDDGSTDGTLDFLQRFEPNGYHLMVNQWNRKGVHVGTNGIFRQALNVNFDFGFKADDDIIFLKPGWDHLYMQAAEQMGFEHLCYYNSKWKKAPFNRVRDKITAQTKVEKAMGCFWTFTPGLIRDIGWFDVAKFGKSGYGHVDYSQRACRAAYNDDKYFYDATGSNDYITMQGIDDKKRYMRTLNEKEQAMYWSSRYRRKSLRIVKDSTRLYIGENSENQQISFVEKGQ